MVSTVIERNPVSAISLLLPRYGPGVVCGGVGMEDFPALAAAEKRLGIVQEYARRAEAPRDVSACIDNAQELLKQAEGKIGFSPKRPDQR